MRLLAQHTVYYNRQPRVIQLYHGDLTALPDGMTTDILVVSARPHNYVTTRGTLIKALYDKGVSVADIAANAPHDWRENFYCWLSAPIDPALGLNVGRILGFEPPQNLIDGDVVGEIFRALMPVLSADDALKTVALPLVATGRRHGSVLGVLEGLLEAAVHWLALGLPVQRLMIVEYEEQKAYEASGMFQVLQRDYVDFELPEPDPFKFDLFISYSTRNKADMERLLDALYQQQPQLRIFVDRQELHAGMAWQQEIYDALEACRKVVCLLSPDYLASKICLEEFNIALYRHRDAGPGGVLLPIYLHDAQLPIYMRLLQFIDCRGRDTHPFEATAAAVVAALG